jgi:ubiquinone/menaquinone biosynthesis C-methylase UbiE
MDAEARAARFDERAAPPEEARAAIVHAIGDVAGVAPGQCWLELGPGTGVLSAGILGQGVRYVGVDRSAEMLAVFRSRLGERTSSCTLIHGDGNDPWPADDGSVDVVFCSRVVHHLRTEHTVCGPT